MEIHPAMPSTIRSLVDAKRLAITTKPFGQRHTALAAVAHRTRLVKQERVCRFALAPASDDGSESGVNRDTADTRAGLGVADAKPSIGTVRHGQAVDLLDPHSAQTRHMHRVGQLTASPVSSLAASASENGRFALSPLRPAALLSDWPVHGFALTPARLRSQRQ